MHFLAFLGKEVKELKASKFFSFIFGILGTALMLLTVVLSLTALDREVGVSQVPAEATACTQQLMVALADGDYTTAEEILYGDSRLGDPREASSALGKQVWRTFADSFAYSFNGPCYATEKGLSRDVTITTMDITSVFESLRDHGKRILEEKEAEAEEAGNPELVYQDGKILDSVMEQIESTAVMQALTQDAETITTTVTLELVIEDGAWKIVPSAELLKAVSGGL